MSDKLVLPHNGTEPVSQPVMTTHPTTLTGHMSGRGGQVSHLISAKAIMPKLKYGQQLHSSG